LNTALPGTFHHRPILDKRSRNAQQPRIGRKGKVHGIRLTGKNLDIDGSPNTSLSGADRQTHFFLDGPAGSDQVLGGPSGLPKQKQKTTPRATGGANLASPPRNIGHGFQGSGQGLRVRLKHDRLARHAQQQRGSGGRRYPKIETAQHLLRPDRHHQLKAHHPTSLPFRLQNQTGPFTSQRRQRRLRSLDRGHLDGSALNGKRNLETVGRASQYIHRKLGCETRSRILNRSLELRLRHSGPGLGCGCSRRRALRFLHLQKLGIGNQHRLATGQFRAMRLLVGHKNHRRSLRRANHGPLRGNGTCRTRFLSPGAPSYSRQKHQHAQNRANHHGNPLLFD